MQKVVRRQWHGHGIPIYFYDDAQWDQKYRFGKYFCDFQMAEKFLKATKFQFLIALFMH